MDEPDAALEEGRRRDLDASGGVPPRLDATTGSPSAVPQPSWSTEDPWQVRHVREVAQGLTSPSPAMRRGRRQLGWFVLAALAAVVVAVLVALV
jgi:hypothetical protein